MRRCDHHTHIAIRTRGEHSFERQPICFQPDCHGLFETRGRHEQEPLALLGATEPARSYLAARMRRHRAMVHRRGQ